MSQALVTKETRMAIPKLFALKATQKQKQQQRKKKTKTVEITIATEK